MIPQELPRREIVRYELPRNWIAYDSKAVMPALVAAKAGVLALSTMPYQRTWFETLQEMQLKREVAGTSRIEGADFTDRELELAMRADASPEDLLTRSQRQAHAAVQAYRWIAALPDGRPVDGDLVRELHRRIVTGCDDDHCEPGALRGRDYNVTFGIPPHRGVEGGKPCEEAFGELLYAVQREYREHDLLIQALALHYHFAAMHPFMDGNGRTARALEALMLQRADLTERAFIAMSNYYCDEKTMYLATLSKARSQGHDLTPFLIFGLKGIALQCQRLNTEIRKQTQRALFQNMMYDLFNRLESTRKRVIKDRQIEILKILLDVDRMDWHDLIAKAKPHYPNPKTETFYKTFQRDFGSLAQLGAIKVAKAGEQKWDVSVNLQWPQEMTETAFFEKIRQMPKAKTYKFLP